MMPAQFVASHIDSVGLPCPGVEARLVPVDGKTEVRYRGPNVTPGYWRNPDATAECYPEGRDAELRKVLERTGEPGRRDDLVDLDGEACACGSYGCVETYASGPRMVARAQRRGWRTSESGVGIGPVRASRPSPPSGRWESRSA